MGVDQSDRPHRLSRLDAKPTCHACESMLSSGLCSSLQVMGRAGRVALLVLLAIATAAAAQHVNGTIAAYTDDDEERDEDGYRYGGKFVPNFSSQPYKAKWVQCE